MKITAADFEKVVREAVNQRMKIAGAGGSPGQPYTPPKEDPKNPYVPAPTRKLAAANNIKKTGGPLANDDDYEGLQIGYNYVFNHDRTIKFITK